jgi:hypothetical protein
MQHAERVRWRGRLALPVLTLGILGAALVHEQAAIDHWGENRVMAWAFIASVICGGIALLALAMFGPRPGLILAAVICHAAMLLVGGWSRTFGLAPIEEVEPITLLWTVAVGCEAAAVTAGLTLLAARNQPVRR